MEHVSSVEEQENQTRASGRGEIRAGRCSRHVFLLLPNARYAGLNKPVPVRETEFYTDLR